MSKIEMGSKVIVVGNSNFMKSDNKLLGRKGKVVYFYTPERIAVKFKKNWNGKLHDGISAMPKKHRKNVWFFDIDALRLSPLKPSKKDK